MAKKEAKVNNKENNKNKKSFFKGFKAELKKVIWPTPKQLFNNTVAVIAIVLITTLMVFLLDLIFESANKYGVDKLKEIIATQENENTEAENTSNNEVDANQTSTNENQEATDTNSAEGENTAENTDNTQSENTAVEENTAE